MHIFFGDDSARKGIRGGMGTLVAFGGILIEDKALRPLSDAVDAICKRFEIPPKTELKWSPPKGNWIRENLVKERRYECYSSVLVAAREHGARVVVVAWDTGRTKLQGKDAFQRCVDFALERVNMHLDNAGELGLVVTDRPGGGKKEEDAFLDEVLGTIESGTAFVDLKRISLTALTANSHHMRQLQVADIVTGVTTAMVAGDTGFAAPYFKEIIPMFIKNSGGLIGGTGLKLFPDELVNVYHWTLGEKSFMRMGSLSGVTLPWWKSPYFFDETNPEPAEKPQLPAHMRSAKSKS